MIKVRKKSMHPISKILCSLYDFLRQKGEISFDIGEKHRKDIDSIVKTVNSSYFGYERFSSYQERACAYFYFIIKDHALPDGNKRLAVLFFEIYTQAAELEIKLLHGLTLDQIAISVEQEKKLSVDEIIKILQKIFFKKY